jgi:F-type H+-transporting ATPase subunit b
VQNLTQFAAAKSNIFTSLGIDWQMLILQIVAFLLLVFALGKWVYPWLMKSVDDRQAAIEEANNSAEEAKKAAEQAEEKMEELLADARKQAADIVATARLESADVVSAAQTKAQTSADHIISEAHAQLEKDITTAQKMLHDQTLELVSLATEKVVGKVNSKTFDNGLIAEVLKETK